MVANMLGTYIQYHAPSLAIIRPPNSPKKKTSKPFVAFVINYSSFVLICEMIDSILAS